MSRGWFCFVPWHTPEGAWTTDGVEGWEVIPVTFGLGLNRPWLVAECIPFTEGAPLPDMFEHVPARLERLLCSAMRYYPAIALARETFEAGRDLLPDDKEQYAERLADEVERHLLAQREAPYFMAQAIEPCYIGYRFAGEYVWIVAYEPRLKRVFWVTDDFFVYDSPIAHFRLDEEQVQSLPSRSLPPWVPED